MNDTDARRIVREEIVRTLTAMADAMKRPDFAADLATAIEAGIAAARGEYYLVERQKPEGGAEWMGLRALDAGISPREFWTTSSHEALHFNSPREAEPWRRHFNAEVTGHMDCSGPQL